MTAQMDQAANGVYMLVTGYAREGETRVHVEDAISAAAALAGEACLGEAGELNVHNHDLPPGQIVRSDRVSDLLSGGKDRLHDLPPGSVFGALRNRVIAVGFADADFPDIGAILRSHLLRFRPGDPDSWGWVPLSVPIDSRPRKRPLRAAFDLRYHVDTLMRKLRVRPGDRWRLAVQVLSRILGEAQDAIDRKAALTIAFETVHGMARLAPMIDSHLRDKSGRPKR